VVETGPFRKRFQAHFRDALVSLFECDDWSSVSVSMSAPHSKHRETLVPWLNSPYEAIEPAEIKGKIGQLVEEQKDADTDEHGSGKSLDPEQVTAQSLKDR
jgi:hypothetical protein